MHNRFFLSAVRAVMAPLMALFLLSACSGVTLVSPYDERIEIGISEYNQDLLSFVTLMEARFGTEGGIYAKNEAFYANQGGVLDTLIMRAEIQDPGHGCAVSGKAIALISKKIPKMALTKLPR